MRERLREIDKGLFDRNMYIDKQQDRKKMGEGVERARDRETERGGGLGGGGGGGGGGRGGGGVGRGGAEGRGEC